MDDIVRQARQVGGAVQELRAFRTAEGGTYALVTHIPEEELIVDTWIGGFRSEQEFQDVLIFICEQFETGAYKYWLADLRLLNSSFFHSAGWLAEYVFPRVLAAGLVREAVVLPEDRGDPSEYDVFGSASAALHQISAGRIRGFDDIDLAKTWLLEGRLAR